MATFSNLAGELESLRRQRDRLAADIRGQQRLLEEVRGRVIAARRDPAAEAVSDFDAQIEQLSPYLRETRAALLRRLRAQVENGEAVPDPDLVALCRNSRIER